MSAGAPITVRVPAKINLQLAVGAARDDGYHELATVFHAVSLYDDITAMTPDDDADDADDDYADGSARGEITVTVSGEQADQVPAGPDNLAVRAARLLAGRAGVEAGARLHISKDIPVAGGMAGGSADAAAALVACDLLWGTGLSRDELRALGGELGSDVPFALMGGTAIGSGRGERLTPALARGRYHWVLAIADQGLSTPAVYAETDRLRGRSVQVEPQVSPALMQALRSGDAKALGATLSNDLQEAACRLAPYLRATLDVGHQNGALGSVVSGSGPTVAFLVSDNEHALNLAVALTASGVVRSVKRVHGPVHGARNVESVRSPNQSAT